jgi:AcrR family transcriptional regulator
VGSPERPDETRPRRAGRPRAGSRPVVGDPTDEILGVAARLFGELGVGGTTMSRIAAGAGLKQSSLYYYFHSRDDVVAGLLARANVVPLDLAERLARSDASPAARLYRFVRGDVEALCALPFDINEVHRIAARDRDTFAGYWDDRRRLERRLSSLVRAGQEDGSLRAVDPPLAAVTIMANDEGVQNWYRLGTSRRPAAIGRALAELTVGGLLADSRGLPSVVADGEAIGL